MNQMLKILVICCSALLIQLTSLSLRAEIFTHQLTHQPAEKLAPIIQSMVSADTKLAASGFKLIVNGSQKENSTIKQLLLELDTPFIEYIVELEISSDKPVKLSSHQKVNQKNLNRRISVNSSNANSKRFKVRLIENYQAYVSTGESFPESRLVNHYNSFIPSSGRTRIASGFYLTVSPSTNEQVTVIATAFQQQRLKNNQSTIKSSSSASQISTKLNEWTLLASTENNLTNNSNAQSKTYRSNQHPDNRFYRIKVTQVKPD